MNSHEPPRSARWLIWLLSPPEEFSDGISSTDRCAVSTAGINSIMAGQKIRLDLISITPSSGVCDSNHPGDVFVVRARGGR